MTDNIVPGLLAATIAVPFGGAVLIMLAGAKRDLLTLTLPFLTLIPAFMLGYFFVQMPADQTHVFVLGALAEGLTISFMLEPLGVTFAAIVSVLWPISMLYSLDYLYANQLRNKRRFCACFTLAIGSAFGIAFAGDLLTLLIFYELMTLVTYPLVTHYGSARAKRAGSIYLAFLLGSSFLLFLPGVIWFWVHYGTLAFTPGGIVGGAAPPHPIWLLVFAFGIGKAALMPLHRWLPEAMVAPAPVSALLHAVAVVKAGVFAIAKIIVYVFGLDFLAAGAANWLVYIAGISIIVAALLALRQDSLKRRLAYSTVSQLSYITMGMALLKPALIGAVFHLAAHAFAKITLFFAAGAIQTVTGKEKISTLRGIGHTMPWTMLCFAIAALSLIGLPPAAGFVSKWFLLGGAVHATHYFAIGVLIVSTVLNIAYFAPIVCRAFVPVPHPYPQALREAPSGMLIAMLLTAAIVLLLFFFPEPLLGLAREI